VNGMGSLGAIFEGPIVGVVSETFGWNGVLICCIFMSFAVTMATLKAHLAVVVEEKHLARASAATKEQQQIV
jgi:sugar phosphate permease